MNKQINILDILEVLVIILMSNTMYFGLIYRKITICILFLLTIMCIIVNKKINKKNLYITILFMIIMSFNSIINFKILDKQYLYGVIEILLMLMCIAIITGNLQKKKFCRYYINIICFFSFISIINNLIANFMPQYAHLFYSNVNYGQHLYKVSPFYTWGWEEVFSRNAGPFWEPGAFQGFINIAILTIVNNKNIITNCKQKLILLIITLITTQSTSGYIIFLLILIAYWKDIITTIDYKISVKKVLIVIILISSVIIIFKSNNISQKFNQDNGSKTIRSNDFTNSIKMFLKRPISGYGSGLYKSDKEKEFNIFNNSNGLLYLLYSQGIILFSYYVFRILKGINNIFVPKSVKQKAFLIMIFFALYFTEGLAWLSFYMVFLFELEDYSKKSS